MGTFPSTRLRRNRRHTWLRDLTAETCLTVNDLILPLFVTEGSNSRQPIASLPLVERLSIDLLIEQAKAAQDLGIKAVVIFPVTDDHLKSEEAAESYSPKNLICRAVTALKTALPNMGIICDVALDPYTTHGHDGIFRNNEVVNDLTNIILAKQALSLANAGADVIAPSDMMDGRVGFIREQLDCHLHHHVAILSYASKYASSFYGPFRDALGSASNLGKANKSSYQMDPRNSNESLREIEMDIKEGADIIMIKPANLYLDIIRQAKDRFHIPIFAYQVSGEYAAIKAASQNGWLDDQAAIYESLLAIKRAGANAIITYAAMQCAAML